MCNVALPGQTVSHGRDWLDSVENPESAHQWWSVQGVREAQVRSTRRTTHHAVELRLSLSAWVWGPLICHPVKAEDIIWLLYYQQWWQGDLLLQINSLQEGEPTSLRQVGGSIFHVEMQRPSQWPPERERSQTSKETRPMWGRAWLPMNWKKKRKHKYLGSWEQ